MEGKSVTHKVFLHFSIKSLHRIFLGLQSRLEGLTLPVSVLMACQQEFGDLPDIDKLVSHRCMASMSRFP